MMVLAEIKMCQIKTTAKRIGFCFVVLGLGLGLTSCVNEDVSDLTEHIQNVKTKPKGTIPPLPEIKVVEPFIFNPDGLRDPFRHMEKVEEESLEVTSGSGIVPDTSRRKEELEAYPLDTLQMVGTLTMEKQLWGLIKASDGTIHRVQKGNHMGRHYGEIFRILGDRVELMEIVPDKPGSWIEQQALLELVE